MELARTRIFATELAVSQLGLSPKGINGPPWNVSRGKNRAMDLSKLQSLDANESQRPVDLVLGAHAAEMPSTHAGLA